jgi:DUF1365 family protein
VRAHDRGQAVLGEAVDAIEEAGAEHIAPEPLIARLRDLVRDRDGVLAFDATLNLKRRPYSRRHLLGASLRTLALIYSHALLLKLKGVPIHPHPRTEAS